MARSKDLGLVKGNQWLISPDHKALFLGGYVRGGWFISHKVHCLLRVYFLKTNSWAGIL